MSEQKGAKARIKINKLFQEAGWRFLDDGGGPANIVLEKVAGALGVLSSEVFK